MIRVRFTDEDRQRYSLPEWIDFDPERLKVSELRRIKRDVGWDLSQLRAGMDAENIDERTAARSILWWIVITRYSQVSWEDFDLDIFGVEIGETPDPNLSAPTGA